MFTGPDSLRTPITDIDFTTNSKISTDAPSNFPSGSSGKKKPSQLPDCQVFLDDVLSSSSTVKFMSLKINPEKTHSVSSRQALERHYLEYISTKDPIAWPSMNSNSEWEKLDCTVGNALFNLPTLFERVFLLENSIYTHGSSLFGIVRI